MYAPEQKESKVMKIVTVFCIFLQAFSQGQIG